MVSADNRNRPSLPESETHNNTSATVGAVAIKGEEAGSGEASKTYAEEVCERTAKLSSAESAIIKGALDRGVPESKIPRIVADAMNEGAHPKAILGMQMRGTGVSLILLDGHVPPEALEVNVRNGQGQVYSTVSLADSADELVGDNFSVESTGMLPQYSEPGDPIDREMLAKIDAHFQSVPPGA